MPSRESAVISCWLQPGPDEDIRKSRLLFVASRDDPPHSRRHQIPENMCRTEDRTLKPGKGTEQGGKTPGNISDVLVVRRKRQCRQEREGLAEQERRGIY
jgi:hypothetical protein